MPKMPNREKGQKVTRQYSSKVIRQNYSDKTIRQKRDGIPKITESKTVAKYLENIGYPKDINIIIEDSETDIENSKIAIASIVRNEERDGNLKRFLDCCQDLERYHKNLIYIFIEGDSSDKTYDILKSWIEKRDGSILKKIDKKRPQFPKTKDKKRTEYLAELRNTLVDLILSIPDISEILIIDANYGWKGDIIKELRQTGSDIAAPLVVSHKDNRGKYIFYDIWAFRKNGREFGPFYPYINGMAFDRPVNIDSAGGGYLIKRHVLEAGVRYSGGDCEHVNFCRRARNIGFSIKINPKIYIRKGGYKE